MKNIILAPIFLCTFSASAAITPGLYHLVWVNGTENSYKIVKGVVSDTSNINSSYFFVNRTDQQSNDEVYLFIKQKTGTVFYKHEEIEGGPTIGWADFTIDNGILSITPPTTKNFYDNTSGDNNKHIKYKVGVKFSGRTANNSLYEKIPVSVINTNSFKVECTQYFKANQEDGSNRTKSDPMQDFSDRVLLSNDGLCNAIYNKYNPTGIKNGWMFFEKIQ